MKTLCLLRHAAAIADVPGGLGDHARVLSKTGAEEAASAAEFMRSYDLYPDFVLSSSAVRTIQTMRIIMGTLLDAEGRKVASHIDRRLYLAEAQTIMEDIRQIHDHVDLLLVIGHNPGIGEVAMRLSATAPDPLLSFPTAALAVFKGDFLHWQDFTPSDIGLEHHFTP